MVSLSRRVLNKILDLNSKIFINEMAFDRKTTLIRISNFDMTIIELLVKIAIFKQKSTWIKELINRFLEIEKLIPHKNKMISEDDIYNVLYEQPILDTGLIKKNIIRLLKNTEYSKLFSDYRKVMHDEDIDNITRAISVLIDQVSGPLSDNNFDPYECEEILNYYLEDIKIYNLEII